VAEMSRFSDSEKRSLESLLERSVDLSEEDSDETSNTRKVSMMYGDMIAGTRVGLSAWLRA